MGLIPRTRAWTRLDAGALVARSPAEWQKATALAKAFSFRRAAALGSEVDDLIQDALHHLDQQLRLQPAPDAPPESILLRYFACRAHNAVRNRSTREEILDRRAGELAPAPPASPDDLLDAKRWAVAFDIAVAAERDGPDGALLEAVLLGSSLAEIASTSGTGKTTVHRRLAALHERLRDRILAELSRACGSR